MTSRHSIARWTAGILATIATLLEAAPANAVDFILYSQNILRFGHGKRTATQCSTIGGHILTVDIILIQELMVSATPCTSSVLPGTYVWTALGPYGAGSYWEYYGFLYSSTARTNGPTVRLGPKTASAAPASYARPPQGILFEIIPYGQTAAKRVWIANFHAVWGKNGITPRRNEATAAAGFATYMAAVADNNGTTYTGNVIVGGDWNLPANDGGFNAFTNNGYSVRQTALTSIARTGAMSQSYDHFAVSPTITVGAVSTVGFTGNPLLWRQTVSDHLGVQMEVTLP